MNITKRSLAALVAALPRHGVDLLLDLDRHPELRVLVIEQPFERVSDAHMSRARDWMPRPASAPNVHFRKP
jgi:hypothetical protein